MCVIEWVQYQMVIDPEGTPEQKAARGTHWVGKTFEQVGLIHIPLFHINQSVPDLFRCCGYSSLILVGCGIGPFESCIPMYLFR